MSDYDRYASPRAGAGYARSGAGVVDQGLRAYMIGVYNYMTLGLGVTGLVAYGAFTLGTVSVGDGRLGLTQFGHAIYASPLRWLIVLSPLALVFWISARLQSMSVATARNAFIAFAALIGLSLSALLVIYTGASIGRAFFATAAAFASLSLYGYTTRRDLSAMGSFMMMGVIGLIIASLINMFLQSTGLQFALSVICVLGVRGSDRLGHPVDQVDVLRGRHLRDDSEEVDPRRAQALPGLHQHVPGDPHVDRLAAEQLILRAKERDRSPGRESVRGFSLDRPAL